MILHEVDSVTLFIEEFYSIPFPSFFSFQLLSSQLLYENQLFLHIFLQLLQPFFVFLQKFISTLNALTQIYYIL